MINVTFFKDGNNICGFESKGHSESDVHGKDIVCASVSGILLSVANTITGYLHVKAFVKYDEGYLSIDMDKSDSDKKTVQAVMQVAYIGLIGIVEEYSEYVKVSIEDRRMSVC